MSSIFEFMDALGPTRIVYLSEPSQQLKAILVLDNIAAGPAIGGLRMASNVTLGECVRLARAMTLKNAVAGLPHGGGKSVVYADPTMPEAQKEQLVRALACALKGNSDYIFGPDMGTDERCMAWIKDEGGQVVGLPPELGGIPLDQIGATGWGVSHAIDVALNYCGFGLDRARVVVQGFGAVGQHLARFLDERGAVLVAVSDSRGTAYDSRGLSLEQLFELKAAGRSVSEYSGCTALAPEAVVGIECDIWVPAARPDVVYEGNVDQLKTKLVVQGANIPMTDSAEALLHQRGVLVVPDFIANAGGVICGAMEFAGASQSAAMQTVEDKVRANTDLVLAMAKEQKIQPREAAMEVAVERVKTAMSMRRWGLY